MALLLHIVGLYWAGKPQWGYCNGRQATFPVSFVNAAYSIVAIPNTTSTSATATGAANLSKTGSGLYLHGSIGWYVVIGS